MSIKFLALALSGLVLLQPAGETYAQSAGQDFKIAAVVNDDIISDMDVNNRISLVIGTTGLSDSPEVRNNLRGQIIRSMIDEKLQWQEAQRNGITVTEEDISKAIAGIEKQNNQPPGSFDSFLERKGLSKPSFLEQVKAQIAWSKLLVKKIRGRIKVTDSEVAQNRTRLAAKASGGAGTIPEVMIATISLPVYSPEQDASTRKLANKLSNEIKKGVNFDAVASQFAGEGADATQTSAFWVQVDQIDPAVAKALSKTRPGTVTEPIRTASGYQIVKLFDLRQSSAPTEDNAEYALKQIILTLKPDAKNQEVDVLMQIAKLLRQNPGSCSEKGVAGIDPEDIEDANIDVSFNRVVRAEISNEMRPIIEKLKVGEMSEPFATPRGIHLLMLCEKIEIPASTGNKELIKEALFQEKVGLEAAKFMRNLRREAFVDIKK